MTKVERIYNGEMTLSSTIAIIFNKLSNHLDYPHNTLTPPCFDFPILIPP